MSDNENQRPAAEQAKVRGTDLANLLSWVLGFGALVLFVAWWSYLWTFGGSGLTREQGVWGQLGDFIGGVTNPILSFLALIALLMTVKLQADQLNAAREELAEARAGQERAEKRQLEQVELARQLAEAQGRTAQAQESAARALSEQLDLALRAATWQDRAARAQAFAATLSAIEFTKEHARHGSHGVEELHKQLYPVIGAMQKLAQEALRDR
jgi:hypothetical protein